jgi:CheY-like chemotaxis protein
MIRLLGSDIRLVSEKGKGSFFSFVLPYETPETGLISKAPAKAEVTFVEKPVILYAEDDDTNLFLLEIILKNEHITIIPACNGKEAVDTCHGHPEISLVLMDMKMPVMDGLEATREIKSFRKDLPIIAVTAFAMTGDEKRAREAGCDDYIAKPVRKEFLFEKLNKYGIKIL